MEYAKTIEIGEYLEMGTYYEKPILWRCVDIDENGPLMLSDKILCLKAFDAEGTNTNGSHSRGYYDECMQSYWRQQWGSNYWTDSNMRCWLNSKENIGKIEWLCGNAPTGDKIYYNAYSQETGFLTNFTSGELGAIKEVTQKSLLDGFEFSASLNSNYHRYNSDISKVVQNYNTAHSEQVTDKIFLLDVKQINAVYNNRSILGNDYYIGEPTEECVSNSEYTNNDLKIDKKWESWLRSPDACLGFSSAVRCVLSDGTISSISASAGIYGGVRPAFYLNLDNIKLIHNSKITIAYTIS